MKPKYADNFALALADIEAKVAPLRKCNMARVQTLLQLELKNAMQRFKADLRFDAQRIGSWFVAFEDGSAYTPTPEILKPLRRLFDRRVMA